MYHRNRRFRRVPLASIQGQVRQGSRLQGGRFLKDALVVLAFLTGILLGHYTVHPDYLKHEGLAYVMGYDAGVFDEAQFGRVSPAETCKHVEVYLQHLPELKNFDTTHRLHDLNKEMEIFCAIQNDPSLNAPSSDDNPDSAVTQNN